MEKCAGAFAVESIGLTSADFARLTELYENRLLEHGLDAKTVGWGSRSDQSMRFEVLCRGLDLRGKRVLDIGCGLGDFVPWAEEKYGADFDYLGVDLSRGLIIAAQERFTRPRRQFLVGTLTPDRKIGEFDITVLSGALTFKTKNNIATMRTILSRAWDHSREAMCCNFMSSYVDSQTRKNFHYSPEKLFSFAKTLSRFVTVHHDYDLWEFTLQVFREPALKREPQS